MLLFAPVGNGKSACETLFMQRWSYHNFAQGDKWIKVLQSTLWAISLLTQTTLTFQLTFSADKNKEIKQKRKNINQQKRQSPNKRNQFVDSVQTNLTLRYQAHLSRSEKRDDHQLELYTCRSNLNLIGTT